MKKNTIKLFIVAAALLFAGCDKKNEDLVEPLSTEDFPQVILLSDEDDGGLEDEDAFSMKITLADRQDADKKELGGKVVPLKEPVTVSFAVTETEGFDKLSDYIKDGVAFYEIDECTTSLDKGINLNLQFDPATGKGSVIFPAGVEEIEIEFETDEDLFNDNDFNTDARGITFQLTGITGNHASVTVNKTASFTYHVQDDEGIYGEWELDPGNAAEFARFKQLFGMVNEDIKNLSIDEVDEIVLEFEHGEVKAIVVLKEEEEVEECGSIEMENKVIEVEAEIEELSDDETEGDVEFGETLELDKGVFRAFVYKGSFSINGKTLEITLEGEFGDESTDKIKLTLEK